MATNSSESLSAGVQVVRDVEPRTFARNDIIFVDESSPREPYLSFTIGPHPLRRLIIKIWSHDQGYCNAEYKTDQPYANSHTWFALGIVPETSDPLRHPDEPYLCEIQRNVRESTETKCHILEWRLNTPFEEDQSDENEAQGWLDSISSGSRVEVGVFPLAEYFGWVNVVYQAEVELYYNSDTTLPSATGPTAGGAILRATYTSDSTASPIIDEADAGTRSMDSLTRLIDETQGVLDQPLSCDSKTFVELHQLAYRLEKRYEQTKSIEDLTRLIEVAQKAVEATPDDDPSFITGLSNLSLSLMMQYDVTKSTDHLARAIELAEECIKATPDGHSHLARRLNILSICLLRRHKYTQSTDDLARAIEVAQECIKAIPDDDPGLAMYKSNLGLLTLTRYCQTKSPDDLSRSIELTEQAVKMTPDVDFDLAGDLANLAVKLNIRNQLTGSVEDLTRSIETFQKAFEMTSHDPPKHFEFLGFLGNSLGDRYKQTGQISDLGSAIEMLERVVKIVSSRHPSFAGHLRNLGAWLGVRFQATGSMEDLERALKMTERAIAITPDTDHEALAICLNNLGVCFSNLSNQTHSADDMDKAIELTERAIAIIPENSPHLASTYSTIGMCYIHKSDRTGSTDSLTRAIEFCQKAVEANHNNEPNIMHSTNFGNALTKRYEWTGSIDDLTKAIEVLEKAVGAASRSHPHLHMAFGNLAGCFGLLYERTRSADDLTKAIEASENAVELTPRDHTTLTTNLANLGTYLAKRYERARVMDDLTRAIEISQQAVEAADSLTLALCLSHLGNRLFDRYVQTESTEDLMRATEAAQKAVEAIPHGHRHLAKYLGNLGNMLGHRHAQTHAKSDLDTQLSVYVRSWHCATSPPSDRIPSATLAANIHAYRGEWDEAYDLLRGAVLLLPKVSPRSLKQPEMQRMLSPISGLATDAAAMAINAGKAASEVLSILELGRGVIAGLLIDTRGDLSDLRETHPSLADSFVALRNELDLPSQINDSVINVSMVNRRHEASREFDEVIEQIRAQYGFHDFLQPPPAEKLRSAAKSGPIVVINVSSYRCDAILVECETIRLLELPNYTPENVPEYVWNIDFDHHPWPLYEWLWTTICRPCLDALGFTEALGDDAQWPHVWWIPTGRLSRLPLHAAGIYTSGSKETVLDRVVSSYASSIKALQHGRHQRGGLTDEQQNTAILIAMEDTKKQTFLPNARKEIDEVRALCPQLHLKAIAPPRRKADILEHLQKCKILHFAGHGTSSIDPSKSCILLDDWETNPLTVTDLRQSWLQESPAFLAYLSACSTGSNRGEGLADEALHLVSAFQLAGFRHVVGTLWEVSDPHCVEVATALYQTLRDDGMTDEAVSYGLHRAIRKLRDDSSWGGTRRDPEREDKRPTAECSLNTYWIPFIHFGA